MIKAFRRGPLSPPAIPVVLAVATMAAGCASIAPKESPAHFSFMGSATTNVISAERALDRGATLSHPDNLLGERPSTLELVGLKVGGWFALRGLEALLEKRVGRPLKWWERWLVWGPPVALQTWATYENYQVGRR